MSAYSSAFTRWTSASRASSADDGLGRFQRKRAGMVSRVWALVGLLFLAALITLGLPMKAAQAQSGSEVTLTGPRSAEATPYRNRTAFFADIDLYSRSRTQAGPYRLVIENTSQALGRGASADIEIWHNMQRVASTGDFFDGSGKPIAKINKTIDVRPFLNLVIVKVSSNSPVKFTWRIVAGDATPPAPPQLTGIAPSALTLTNGSAGVFNLSLAPAPSAAGQVSVSSSVPGAATVASSVPFAAGQTTVAVPVQAVGVGSSSVKAQLGSSSVSANVQVNPAPPRLASLLPAQAQLQQGASGDFSVSISPAQLQAVTIQLLSSDPAKVSVPASVSIPAGQTSASFQGRALATGNAQIAATIQGVSGGGGGSAYSQVQVVPQPPTAVSLLPSTNALNIGSSVTMTVAISAAQSTPTTVALSAAQSAVAGVPAQVVVPAGATQASFVLQALSVGNTLVSASLNGSAVEAAVQVNPVPAAIASLAPATASVTKGAQTELLLTLNGAQASATTIQLASSPVGVVQVPGTLVIPAGQTEGRIAVTALAVGQADVIATLGGVSRSSAITVTPQPAAIDTLLPNPLGLQQEASGNLTVRLKSSQAQPLDIAIATSDAAKLRVPASVTIPAGQIEQSFTVQALAVGQATVSVSVNGNSAAGGAQTTVQIAAPPPQIASLLPDTQDLPKGKLGKLKLTLDRAPLDPATVPLSNSLPSTLGVPANVTVPAGQLAIDIPVTALAQGSSTVGASLNGSTAQGVVRVVEAEVTGIVLTPNPASVSAGQSTEIKATATYSDGSERIVTTGAGTAWSVLDPSVATISAEGRLTGVKQGTTKVQALQSVLPTYGNPNPSPVVGQADVTITEGSPLAMSTSKTSLLTGESVVVSITSPYAAGATPFTVNLEASGAGGLEFPATASIIPGLTSVNVTVKAIRAGAVTLRASATQFPAGQLSFTVTNPVVSQVQVTAVAPTSAAPGAQITLTGSGFQSPASANTVSFFGGAPGVVASGSNVNSTTQLVVTVPAQAQTGAITVTNANGSGASPVFTVVRDQDFGFTASPAALRLMQGSNAAAALNLQSTGTQSYEGLAKLSVSGLPAGVTASFDPPQLSAVQTGRLLLQAAADAPLANATLTVRSEATIGGLPWVRESRLSVQVVSKTNVTAVKGRFVTPSGTPVPGVIVRQDTSTNQVTTDAAGNFFLEGLPSGTTTLRFDATPANPLYPIWPMNVVLQAGELRTYPDWFINPPPADEKFKPIANAGQEQRIVDERFPGFEVVLPAGATITGWDGVVKTRIAVEKLLPYQLPVTPPPFAIKEAYQLYFGTPMGGIPSEPVPVSVPNTQGHEPGDKVDIWWFDGSPMGGSGEWKVAGKGTVNADGSSVVSDPGVGIPRFCGVCGAICIPPPPPPPPCSGASCGCGEGMCCKADGGGGGGGGGGGDGGPSAANPILLSTGDVEHELEGLSCGIKKGFRPSWRYSAVDALNNNGGSTTSFGMGWTFSYDMVFLPNNGLVKQLVMPGRQIIRFVATAANPDVYSSKGDTRMDGFEARIVGTKAVGIGGSTIWEVTSPGGQVWRFEPFTDISNLRGVPAYLVEMRDRAGNKVTIERNTKGHITHVKDNANRGFTLAYGSNGFASQMQDHTGRVQTFEYNSDDRLTRTTDPAGRVHEYGYADLPLYNNAADKNVLSTACYSDTILARPTYPQGRVYPLTKSLALQRYPESTQPTINTFNTDRVVAQSNSKGENWKFDYLRTGACVVKVADEAAKTWAYTCRAGQPLNQRVCAGGTCTEPMEGLCPELDSEEARTQGWRFYGGSNQRTSVTKPDGSQYTQWFDSRGNLVKYQNEVGQITNLEFDAQLRKVGETDVLGRTTRYQYDANGKRIGELRPLGRNSTSLYDSVTKRLIQSTRTLDVPGTDAQGNPLSYTPLVTSYTYDAQGNLTSTRDPLGQISRSVYDSQGRLVESIATAKADATAIPVLRDGALASIPPSARKTSYEYNAAGDLVAVTDALGHTNQNTTDDLGRVVSTTDPLNFQSQQQYSNIDKPTVNTDALGQQSRQEYDSVGRVTAVFNAAGVAVERYEYDNLGRKVKTTTPDGAFTTFEYDAMNRVSAVTDRKGQRTTTTYTATGQVQSTSTAGRTVTYLYDAAGRVSETSDASTRVSYQYDEAGRTVQTDTTTAVGSHRLAYEYDSLDRTTKRTLSGTGIAAPEVTTYQWDKAGHLTQQKTLIGPVDAQTEHKTSYSFDVAGRLQSRASQITAASGSAEPSITQRYFYDEVDRLTRIEYVQNAGGASEQLIERIDYSYDAKGQRTAKNTLNGNGAGQNDTPMVATYDASNRMQSITLKPSADTGTHSTWNLSFDANGNTVQKVNAANAAERTTYAWDSDNRLTGLNKTEGGQTVSASFQYDLFGRRISSSIQLGSNPPEVVQFLYEGQQALGEIRSGRLSHRLITGLGLDETIARIAVVGSGAANIPASRQLLTDALNSVIAQANAQGGGVANSYGYSPYGEASVIGPDVTQNPSQYTSRENDAQGASGSIFYRARYYDPVLKRFISEDPIGLAGGMNKYAFVNGNPLSFNDPTGNALVLAPLVLEVCIASFAKAVAVVAAVATSAAIIIKAISCDDCPPDELKCTPPEGTACYEGPDTGRAHGGLSPHYHIYAMFKFAGRCQWKYLGGKVGKGVLANPPPGMQACSSYPGFTGR